eukprot:TRINITY_DN2153_c0_g2_i1.p1 TRINITY_DN2153_c0_g2~~TRINITY_DN2153_c0_g2_i1.p1  ORF type:complete len:421 (+),score=67.94 TRINITY_DN2153_c0_g2_i1:180-1442(+)
MPYGFYTLIYCVTLNSSGTIGFITMAMRFFMLIQTANILLKMDNLITWSWMAIFWTFWIILIIMFLYAFFIFFILLFTILQLCKGRAQKYQIVGLLWFFFLSAGGTSAVFFIIYGYVALDDGSNDGLIYYGLAIGAGLMLFMLIFTSRESVDVKKFMVKMYTVDTRPPRREGELEPRSRFETASLKTLPQFLFKFSSTYFLKEDDKAKIESLKKKIKTKQAAKPEAKPNAKESQNRKVKSIDFAHEVIHLTGHDSTAKASTAKAERVLTAGPEEIYPSLRRHKSTFPETGSRVQTVGNEPIEKDKAKKDDPTTNTLSPPNPGHRKKETLITEKTEKSVNACLVCFDKAPDAVFMDCGHGGICFECAVAISTKSKECYLCREKIKQVLQVDLKANDEKMIKVLSGKNVLVSEAFDPIEYQI